MQSSCVRSQRWSVNPKLSLVRSSDAIEIDRGIPIPAPRFRWPFHSMKVGDSFFVPNEMVVALRQAVKYRHAKKLGDRYTLRSKERGARCWRVA